MSYYFDEKSYMFGFGYEPEELSEEDLEIDEEDIGEYAAMQYEKLYGCEESFATSDKSQNTDVVFKLIKDCAEIYTNLVRLYEHLGGNTEGLYKEIGFFDDSDLPVTDEEIAAIQNKMKKT